MTDPATPPAPASPPEPGPEPGPDPGPDPGEHPRKLLLVAGAGRSGTSTLAGIMSLLGLHVPQPEVVADDSNPKGFGEPRWVVDHHDRLLAEVAVTVSDSRPSAWFETGRIATREPERIRTAEWLEPHFAEGRELVVKDPRLSWFLPLWRVAAVRTAATPVFATMLRPPAEVVGSKQRYYRNRLGSAHLAASWVNMLLHTERATRTVGPGLPGAGGDAAGADDAGGRVFVRYADLLSDWTRTTMRVGEELQLQQVLHAGYEAIRDVHRFVDPSLRRVNVTLDDLELPTRLHELVGETWAQLDRLAEPGGDTPAARRTMDQLREEYVALYDEAEAISRSSVVAATTRARREGREAGRAEGGPGPGAQGDGGGLADRIPHGVRSKIPPGVRRGIRRVARRPRPGQ